MSEKRAFVDEYYNEAGEPTGNYYLHLGPTLADGIFMEPLSFQENPPSRYWSNPKFSPQWLNTPGHAEQVLDGILDQISDTYSVEKTMALQMIINSGEEGLELVEDFASLLSSDPSVNIESRAKRIILRSGKQELEEMIEVGEFFREKVKLEE